ncbi:MAG: type II toxin-antitoxin system Phd/YefM family antitoxin [Planctomycetes bacterium]|nr:type II toxin-antitoxin system Phd/YefM family antitoxin [Planctomycetota bacterium]
MKTALREPEIVLRNGKPARVILDIRDYEELLDRIEDKEDARALAALRRKPVHFRRFGDYLAERSRRARSAH